MERRIGCGKWGEKDGEKAEETGEEEGGGDKFLEEGFKYLPLCARRPEEKNASH